MDIIKYKDFIIQLDLVRGIPVNNYQVLSVSKPFEISEQDADRLRQKLFNLTPDFKEGFIVTIKGMIDSFLQNEIIQYY